MQIHTEQALKNAIDQTLLRADATTAQLQAFCEQAAKNRFRVAMVNGANVPLCASIVKSSGVLVGTVVGFPLGAMSLGAKLFEARDAIENGANEVDYMLNITELKSGNWAYIEREMQAIAALCHERGAVCKVILETCYLTKEEIVAACEIALRARPDFVKTSTGFGSAGATAENVRLMKQAVGDAIQVKASGGIRDLDAALAMLEAGASRIGTSAGAAILEQYRQRFGG